MPAPLARALDRAGFKDPTPIQAQAIPVIKAGSDVLGIAQTGTGKTAAFLLPMLSRMILDPREGIRAVILCPTRELAMQVEKSIQTFAKKSRIHHVAIYGGVNQRPQVNALRRGVDILVATPGRFMDLQQQGHLQLKTVEFFVLDEADRMLDMGFIHDIRKIAQFIPKKRQTLFFSATMSQEVTKLAKSLLHNPVRVEVAPQSKPIEKIEQKVLFVDRENKTELILHLLEREHLDKVLIFTKTKRGADRLARILKRNKITSEQIHGDRTQNQRTKALKAFSDGRVRCLVATDVAARGIDIDDISHVINYDLPMESENYVHRIGRTARAGAEGTAYSFCSAEEKGLLREIQRVINDQIPIMEHKFHSEAAQNSKMKGKPPRNSGSGGGRGPRKGGFRKNKPKGGFRKGSGKSRSRGPRR